MVLTGDAGSFLRLWSTDTYEQVWSVAAGQNSITSLKCVGSKIVTASSDGTIKLWDLGSGSLTRQIASSDAAWHVDLRGDRIISVVSRDGEAILEVSGNFASQSCLEIPDQLTGIDAGVGIIQPVMTVERYKRLSNIGGRIYQHSFGCMGKE